MKNKKCFLCGSDMDSHCIKYCSTDCTYKAMDLKAKERLAKKTNSLLDAKAKEIFKKNRFNHIVFSERIRNIKFVKCYMVDCTPPLEVFKTFIRYFGRNIDIENIDREILRAEEEKDWLVKAKQVWEKNFNTKNKEYED